MINRYEVISSRQNAGVKRVCSLFDKKTRESERLFRFDGAKLFSEAVVCGIKIEKVYIKESSAKFIFEKFEKELLALGAGAFVVVSDHVFEKMTDEKSPEGIITVAKYIDKSHKSVKINNEGYFSQVSERVLLLEAIRDPGNLGTMIRSAAALGINRLVISSDCADIYNAKTIRAAMGGLFRLSIDKLDASLSMAQYIEKLRKTGRRVYAAALDQNAKELTKLTLCKEDCIVIGNEGHGLLSETVAACDGSVIIPMKCGCESLNAAAAAVVFMWELSKAK